MQQKQAKRESKQNKREKQVSTSGSFLSELNFLLILPCFLPLLFSDKTVDVTVPVRYLCMSVVLFVYLLVFFILRKKLVSFNLPLTVKLVFGLGLAFAVWQFVALTQSVSITAGYYEAALYPLLLLLLFVLTLHFKENASSPLAFSRALTIISLLQSFIGMCQLYQLGFENIPGHSSPYALNANGNFFGSAQMLLLPFVLYVWFASGKTWRYTAAFAMAGILASIISSKTRAAWLSTAVIVSVTVLLHLIFVAAEKTKWLKIAGGLVIAVPLIAGFLIVTSPDKDLAKAIKDRTTNLTASSDTTISGATTIKDRFVIWNKTTDIIKQNALLGVGAGNWKIVTPLYGTEGTAWQDASYVPDHVHNIYLQVIAENGVPGALLYFGVFLVVVICGFKLLTSDISSKNKTVIVLMLAGIAGFLTDGLFSFANQRIEHLFYFYVMLAVVLGVFTQRFSETNITTVIPQPVFFLLAGIVAFNIYLGYQKYNFEKQLNRVRAYEKKNNADKMIAEAKLGKNRLVTLDEVGTSIESHLALAYKMKKDFEPALIEIRKAEKLNPGNSKIYNTMGTIYTDMGKFDSAVVCYKRALQLSSKFKVALKNLAVNQYQLKQYSDCIATINRLHLTDDKFFNDLKADCERQLSVQ